MPPPLRLSKAAARRIALAAQGFRDPKPEPGAATMRQVQRVIDRVGVVQIDSVNVVCRSHYLPFFSRLGPYDTALVDRARDRAPRRLVEYWAHEASLVPPDTWPLLDFRMQWARERAWGGMRSIVHERPDLIPLVRDEVAAHGPLTSRECERRLAHDQPRAKEHWGWNWSEVKRVLEFLFWSGEISSAGRTPQFERRYALPEQVLPKHLAAQAVSSDVRPSPDESCLELVRIAARAHGVGTELCLRDYFRIMSAQARPAIARLVADGELIPCEVDGWSRPAYLYAGAARPRAVHAEALLSPFDSLVWQRERTEMLFDFRYRISIYTPAHQRTEGYYVLPFLHGDSLVARVDLKADRKTSTLRALQVTWEPDAPAAARPALEAQLRSMADWLQLTDVTR